MAVKSPYSTYSLGPAVIRSDKPTVEKLKAAARARDITLVEYLRLLADEGARDLQTTFSPPSPAIIVSRCQEQTSNLARFVAALLIMSQPASYIEELRKPGSIMDTLLPETRREVEAILNQGKAWARGMADKSVSNQNSQLTLQGDMATQ